MKTIGHKKPLFAATFVSCHAQGMTFARINMIVNYTCNQLTEKNRRKKRERRAKAKSTPGKVALM